MGKLPCCSATLNKQVGLRLERLEQVRTFGNGTVHMRRTTGGDGFEHTSTGNAESVIDRRVPGCRTDGKNLLNDADDYGCELKSQVRRSSAR